MSKNTNLIGFENLYAQLGPVLYTREKNLKMTGLPYHKNLKERQKESRREREFKLQGKVFSVFGFVCHCTII